MTNWKKHLCMAMLVSLLSSTVRAEFNLIGHWPLNGAVADVAGGHAQAIVGSSFIWTNGAGNAVAGTISLSLNPHNQADTYVDVVNAPDLNFGTNDFTVAYWVNKQIATANYFDAYGVGKWRSGAYPGQNEWSLLLNNGANNDEAAFVIESGTNHFYTAASPSSLSLGGWHQLIGIRRGSALELYVDGVFVATQSLPAGTAVDNAGRDLFFGASAQPGYGAEAFYDDVQLYSQALDNGGVTVGQVAGGQIAALHAHPGLALPSIAVPAPAGLVAWWPANSNVVDVVGANNGRLTNGAAYVAGEVQGAFNFAANSAMVLLTNTAALQLQNFSVEAWIQRGSAASVTLDTGAVAGNALMFGYGDSGYSFAIGPDGRLILTWVDHDDVVSAATVTDTNWHHVAVTTTNGAVVFYLDGVGYPAANYSRDYSFASSPAIGGRADNINAPNNDSFLGAIDELAVYNRALTHAEVLAIYDAGPSGKSFVLARPALTLLTASPYVTVRWPAVAGYSLQQTTNLAAPANWITSTNAITTSNGSNTVSFIPASTGNLFFRLANL